MRTAARVVAAIQIVGAIAAGIVGVALPGTWVDHALVELLALAGIVGGVGVWRDSTAAYRLSLGLQTIQILRLKAPAFTYLVNTGVVLALGVQNGQPVLTTAVAAGIYLGPDQIAQAAPNPIVSIGCNLAALISVLILWAALANMPRDSIRRLEDSASAA